MKFKLLADSFDSVFLDKPTGGKLRLVVDRLDRPTTLSDFHVGDGQITSGISDYDTPFVTTEIISANQLLISMEGTSFWLRTDLSVDRPRSSFSAAPIPIVKGTPIYTQPVVEPMDQPVHTPSFGRFIVREITVLAQPAKQ